MKAVILAAGKGTRMGELTQATPKPLLKINGKTLLEWKMDILPSDCTEVILVIGYLGDQIRAYFGDSYKGMKMTYVEAEPKGTAYALFAAKEHLDGQFVVLCGDDLYTKADIEECVKYPYAALVSRSESGASGGSVVINKQGMVETIVEGTHAGGANIATGLYVLSPEIFELPLAPKAPGSDEYGLPQTLLQRTAKDMKAVFATGWYQVTAPEDLQASPETLALFS